MAKKSKGTGQKVATYFLAQKSGLFAPGAATILANASVNVKQSVKSYAVRKEGQKPLGRGGGQSSGLTAALVNALWLLDGGMWDDSGIWEDSAFWVD